MKNYLVEIGKPFPLGATLVREGVNFAIFSANATAITLAIFDDSGHETRLPIMHKTGNVWHILVKNIGAGVMYGYRVDGDNTLLGNCFNPHKLLVDPYAKAVVGKSRFKELTEAKLFEINNLEDNAHLAPKSVVIDPSFDWQDDQPPNIRWQDTIIYELHVKGFTKLHPALEPEIRGTYKGLSSPIIIDYLQQLGITSVELLPVAYHLDELHLQSKGLANYWGYNPLAPFAVETAYFSGDPQITPLIEFKQMVKALHQAKIEVILDVVFNHSADLSYDQPTYSLRGIDNANYYLLNQQGEYENWTGCGNSIKIKQADVLRWVMDCLRYWVTDCHVDGFRFDLASILGREPDFNRHATFWYAIYQDPILANKKFIVEPWDLGPGGYQVGNYPLDFAEWNDHFRDNMREFWLTNTHKFGLFASRFAGSADIFEQQTKQPYHSINFITAHDGFTLEDLVSYNHKHNLENVENNQDGTNDNYSFNHGVEGETADQAIKQKRQLSKYNLLTALFLANGTPMLLAGDELGNSQGGNNNAYCQDNVISWLAWGNADQELIKFTKQLIIIRKEIYTTLNGWWNQHDIQWITPNAEPLQDQDWHLIQTLQIMINNQWLFLINPIDTKQKFKVAKNQWQSQIGPAIYAEQDYVIQAKGFSVFKRID